jgi:predicted nucleic acid-binding Zn ribbon protein
MPIYSYEHLNKSECKFDSVIQKITDEKLKVCPLCSQEIKNIISLTSHPRFLNNGVYTKEAVPRIRK